MHPPKRETFDLRARTNTDPKGSVRAVDEYIVRPWGLYLARPTPGRAQFHYLESWLLPSLGLRATVFHFNPGHERDQDLYLDVGEYTARRTRVDLRRTTTSTSSSVPTPGWIWLMSTSYWMRCDTVLLTPEAGELAVRRSVAAVDGLARNGYDLNAWLADEGMQLTWR